MRVSEDIYIPSPPLISWITALTSGQLSRPSGLLLKDNHVLSGPPQVFGLTAEDPLTHYHFHLTALYVKYCAQAHKMASSTWWLKILSAAFNLAFHCCYSWWIAALRCRWADLIWIVAWSCKTRCHRSHTPMCRWVQADVQRLLKQQNQQLNWLLGWRRQTVDSVGFSVNQPSPSAHKLSPTSFRSHVGEIKVIKLSDSSTQWRAAAYTAVLIIPQHNRCSSSSPTHGTINSQISSWQRPCALSYITATMRGILVTLKLSAWLRRTGILEVWEVRQELSKSKGV